MNSHKIFLGFGSNDGKRISNINKAYELLRDKVKIIKTSSFYLTKPFGVQNQRKFVNCVASAETNLSPKELLRYVKSIEGFIGRDLNATRHGPRCIDIDILFFDNYIINEKDLIVPHPNLHQRDTVLIPFLDICGEFIHPVIKKNIREIESNLRDRYVVGRIPDDVIDREIWLEDKE